MNQSPTALVVGFVALGAILWPLERWRPAAPSQPRWRRDTTTDLAWWAFTPLVSGALARTTIVTVLALCAFRAGTSFDRAGVEAWLASDALVRRQPAWLQVLEVLLLGDLIGYATHRWFHRRRLWRFHAVHHSPTQVDWLSSVRLHPVNDVLSKVAQAASIVLLGYPPAIVAAYVPFLTFWAIVLHANVRWDLGPLRYVIASPAFHRWHHARETDGDGRNFAGLFPFIDGVFGTLHLPREQPVALGIVGDPVPRGLLAQLRYPFMRPSD